MTETMSPQTGDLWVHTSTKTKYEVLAVGLDAARDETVVIYREASKPGSRIYSRPLKNHAKAWMSFSGGAPRFFKFERY